MRTALSALIAALLLVPSAGSTTMSTAVLRVVRTSPFTVHGWRFHPTERVVVTVIAKGTTRARTTTAGAAGAFTVMFAALKLNDCDPYAVHAVGNEGSRATFKPVQPQCGADPG